MKAQLTGERRRRSDVHLVSKPSYTMAMNAACALLLLVFLLSASSYIFGQPPAAHRSAQPTHPHPQLRLR